jgi:putative transposase
MARGFVYLTAVVDVFSRRVLAHRTAITLEACHAVEALEEAYARFGKPRSSTPIKAASSPHKCLSMRCLIAV